MTPPSLRPRVLALALVAVLALAACDAAETSAAEVDGETITHEQLATDVKLFEFLTALSGSPCGQPVEGETQDSACARLTLTNLIQEDLVKHYAQVNSVVTDPTDVDNAMSQLETSLGGAAGLDKQLADSGLTRADLEALANRLLLFNAVQDAVTAEELTDERVQQIYDENITQYTTVEVAHILVDTRSEAEDVAAEATTKNFAALAKQRSQDPGSADNDGSLGPMVEATFVSQFDPTFVQAALALQPGQISEPVQTQFGWHVIYLMSREVAPLESVREQIVASAGAQAFTDWLQGQLTSAEIIVNPRYGVLDVATGQVTPVRSTNTDSPFEPTASASAAP